jgi:hypothetical protein
LSQITPSTPDDVLLEILHYAAKTANVKVQILTNIYCFKDHQDKLNQVPWQPQMQNNKTYEQLLREKILLVPDSNFKRVSVAYLATPGSRSWVGTDWQDPNSSSNIWHTFVSIFVPLGPVGSKQGYMMILWDPEGDKAIKKHRELFGQEPQRSRDVCMARQTDLALLAEKRMKIFVQGGLWFGGSGHTGTDCNFHTMKFIVEEIATGKFYPCQLLGENIAESWTRMLQELGFVKLRK